MLESRYYTRESAAQFIPDQMKHHLAITRNHHSQNLPRGRKLRVTFLHTLFPTLNIITLYANQYPTTEQSLVSVLGAVCLVCMEKGQPEEEQDLIERAIRKTGCWEEHLACAECMGYTRDWRQCKEEVTLNCTCFTVHNCYIIRAPVP
uniref:RING-type domain-containing protein n=1 Tax=Setaria digitata TaxID=48799 RepID=A0A915PGT7_9BILA